MVQGKTKRIDGIDLMKGICIILVTLGHTMGSIGGGYYRYALITCYMVELPAFYMLSGMLMNGKSEGKGVKELMIKDCYRLLWSYFTFSLLLFLIGPAGIALKSAKAIILGEMFESEILVSQAFCFITSWGAGSVWFLSALFLARAIFWIVNKTKRPVIWTFTVVGIGILLSVLVESNGYEFDDFMSGGSWWYLVAIVARSCICFGFLMLGSAYLPRLLWISGGKKPTLFAVAGLLVCAIASIVLVGRPLNLRYSCLHEFWITIPVAVVSSVCLFVICIGISNTRFNGGKVGKILKWLGINSLIIMGIQNYIGFIAPNLEKVLSHFISGFALANATLAGSIVLFTVFTVIFVVLINKRLNWIIKLR